MTPPTPTCARPRTAAQIDDDNLGEWYEFCEEQGYQFNMVRDFRSSVWSLLAMPAISRIVATGRRMNSAASAASRKSSSANRPTRRSPPCRNCWPIRPTRHGSRRW